MKQTLLDIKIADFLSQKRIAVAGVSRQEGQRPVGNRIARQLRATGYDVFPINPHMPVFDDAPCYPDLRSIPGGVDGVVIVTRPEVTERIVRQCRDAGVPRVWMHQSTGSGPSVPGSSVSAAGVDICRQHDITLIAGACPMMYVAGADFGHRCMRQILKLTGGLPS